VTTYRHMIWATTTCSIDSSRCWSHDTYHNRV